MAAANRAEWHYRSDNHEQRFDEARLTLTAQTLAQGETRPCAPSHRVIKFLVSASRAERTIDTSRSFLSSIAEPKLSSPRLLWICALDLSSSSSLP
jgi:hypothetical protein